ncbi:calcium permeable stress-gated cation channel 1, partial [Tanacetum coccineum]
VQLPIAYHGRASSIVVFGTDIMRPRSINPETYDTINLLVVYNANILSKLVNEKKTKRNWLDYYQLKFDRSNQSERPLMKISKEREKIITNSKYVMPAAFVSFKSRWGAAVCAQSEQSRNSTIWLTEWASEPRDVYWTNLAIPFFSLTVRRLIIVMAFFFLTFFFMIPIAFVQSLANIDGIVKAALFM